MSFSGRTACPRPRREKVFGVAPGLPLDRNSKARILAYVRAYNARMREGRQHTGPVTRAHMDVLRALLYSFHNAKDGRCFPSYERIAEAANCCRATVNDAIKALEASGVLTWVHRLKKIQVPERDLLGRLAFRWRVIRTSNAYCFRNPQTRGSGRTSENPPQPLNPENLSSMKEPAPTRLVVLDPRSDLDTVLIRLAKAAGVEIETIS